MLTHFSSLISPVNTEVTPHTKWVICTRVSPDVLRRRSKKKISKSNQQYSTLLYSTRHRNTSVTVINRTLGINTSYLKLYLL